MKYRQFNQNLDLIDQEVDNLFGELGDHEPTSEEYAKLRENIDGWYESERKVVQAKTEYLAGKVPQWLLRIAGFGVSLGIGKKLWDKEEAGAIISNQAVNIWEKLTRHF